MIDGIGKLRARLRNWGDWLNWEAEIAPKGARCISLESRHIPEAGEVWDEDREPATPTPNVPDAESMNLLIRQLEHIQQYALAMTYGGAPTVMRWRRVGDHVMAHSLDMAEMMLAEMLRKTA
ncbi:MAG: hypothetical protein ACYCZR_02275 [Burkholderiales bacterium]